MAARHKKVADYALRANPPYRGLLYGNINGTLLTSGAAGHAEAEWLGGTPPFDVTVRVGETDLPPRRTSERRVGLGGGHFLHDRSVRGVGDPRRVAGVAARRAGVAAESLALVVFFASRASSSLRYAIP